MVVPRNVLLYWSLCATLACAPERIRTLAPGPIRFDSTGVAIQLRSPVNERNTSVNLCVSFDTTRYLIYIFGVRTLTVRPRRPADPSSWLEDAPDSRAISVDLQLEANNGERAKFSQGSAFGDSGQRECLGSFEFRPGISYTRLWLRSTRPVVVTKVERTWRPNPY